MIRETQDYTLQCGPSREDKQACYQIVNKQYGVIEVETSILPQAIKYIMDLQAGLDMTDEALRGDNVNLSNVTPISDKLN